MLRIETFNNSRGGNAFFKAVTHPLAARAAPDWLRRLGQGKLAVYDIDGQADALAELYDFSGLDLAGAFVQDLKAIGSPVLGRKAQPITALKPRARTRSSSWRSRPSARSRISATFCRPARMF